jgi:chemotaxis protein MotB
MGAGAASTDEVLPMSSRPGTLAPDIAMATVPPPPPPPTAVSETAAASADKPSIEAEIANAVASASGKGSPQVAVERTGGGVLISLTDGAGFGMFSIGSAEPLPETVRVMERIAEILKSRKGKITIRGHTDSRPFRSGSYDNWRLSTDRAQMAYYMLVRGGLDEKRVAAIEGYADRQPKNAENPEAAENRRIEIFLSEDQP